MIAWAHLKIGEKFLGSCKYASQLSNNQNLAKIGALVGSLRDPFWASYALRDLFVKLPGKEKEDVVDYTEVALLGTFRVLFLTSALCRLGRRVVPHPMLDSVVSQISPLVPYFAIFFSTRSLMEDSNPIQLTSDATDIAAHFFSLSGFPMSSAAAGLTSSAMAIWANALKIAA